MAAPTFKAESEIASWGVATSPRNVSRAVLTGDRIVVFGLTGNDLTTLGTPNDGVNTYSQPQVVQVTDFCWVAVWTATAASDATLTISITRGGTGGDDWGMDVLTWGGSSGFGASNKANTSGAPSLSLTTQAANSAVMCAIGDWNAGATTGKTWLTINGNTPTAANGQELVAVLTSGIYTVYVAYWTDAGAAGAKTLGMSAPTGQKYSIVGLEVKGSAGLSAALGTATETDTVPAALGRRKTKALGTTAETDTTVRPGKKLGLNTTGETDTAQPVGRRKTKALGPAAGTDTAGQFGMRLGLNPATETDAAITLTRRKTKALSLAAEADAARQLAMALGLNPATEADTAQVVGRIKTHTLGTTAEADTARQLAMKLGLNPAIEADDAGSAGHTGSSTIGPATETDTARPVGRLHTRAVGTPAETDTVQPVTRTHTRAAGTAAEANTAGTAGKLHTRAVGVAGEADTAQVVGGLHLFTLGTAAEADTARLVTRRVTLLGTATETDTARPITVTVPAPPVTVPPHIDATVVVGAIMATVVSPGEPVVAVVSPALEVILVGG